MIPTHTIFKSIRKLVSTWYDGDRLSRYPKLCELSTLNSTKIDMKRLSVMRVFIKHMIEEVKQEKESNDDTNMKQWMLEKASSMDITRAKQSVGEFVKDFNKTHARPTAKARK